MSPDMAKKAARCVVSCRPDGTYQAAGDHGIYTLREVDGAISCDCIAGSTGKRCAHSLAVQHYIESENS
jgi:hypothetical protein